MPANDGFDPTYSVPRFLAEPAMPCIDDAPEQVARPSRALKASLLIAAAASVGIAALAAGNPMALLADVSAALVGDASSLSTPAIQTVAEAPAFAIAQTIPPAATGAPAGDAVAAPEPAGKDQAEDSAAASDILFKQFQAWAAEQNAQTAGGLAQPAQEPAPRVQADPAPAPAAKNARAPYRLAKKRQQIRTVHNARAEARAQDLRKPVRRAPGARAERPLVQDARAQEQPVQDAQPPGFTSIFGLRN